MTNKSNKILSISEIFSLSKKERKEYSDWLKSIKEKIENSNFFKQNDEKWNKDRKKDKKYFTNEELMSRSYMTGIGKAHKSKRAFERKYEEKRKINKKIKNNLWFGVSIKENDSGDEFVVPGFKYNKYERKAKKHHRKQSRHILNNPNNCPLGANSNYKKINKNWFWY